MKFVLACLLLELHRWVLRLRAELVTWTRIYAR